MTETIHTTREIEALIPHRWPFLLVDRIVEYDAEAKRIVGIKGVTAGEWYFQGHFPGLPVMPGVIQVEALAQTMAVYVAKQPGFGERIGLFAGLDDCRFKRVVNPGDTLRLEVTMDKLGGRFGRGRGVASVDGETACEATHQLHHPRRRGAAMTRLIVLSDVHGNSIALEAVRKAIAKEKPDLVAVAGDLAINGPDPAGAVDILRAMEADGAAIISGNTDIAVADFDYAAAGAVMPGMTDAVPDMFRAAAEWAHDALGDDRVAWLRRLPSERRLHADDGTMILVCHASPGSQTAGFSAGLDPNVTIERASGTDARVIACGHTHVPEVRDLGWKLIVNDGSAGYVFDGDPTASWARIDIDDGTVDGRDQADRIRHHRGRQRDLGARPPRRRLSRGHGPNRETRPMTDRRRVVVTGMGLVTTLGNDVPTTWEALVAGRSGIRLIESFDPSRLTARIAGEVHDLDASGILDRKELRRTDRYIHFALVAAREALDQAGLPERFEGELAENDRGHPRDGARRRRDAHRWLHHQRPARPRPDQPVPHPDGDPEHRRRQDRHPVRDDRPELHDRRRPVPRAATPSVNRARSSGAATPT